VFGVASFPELELTKSSATRAGGFGGPRISWSDLRRPKSRISRTNCGIGYGIFV